MPLSLLKAAAGDRDHAVQDAGQPVSELLDEHWSSN
jgi:hypothetical protein